LTRNQNDTSGHSGGGSPPTSGDPDFDDYIGRSAEEETRPRRPTMRPLAAILTLTAPLAATPTAVTSGLPSEREKTWRATRGRPSSRRDDGRIHESIDSRFRKIEGAASSSPCRFVSFRSVSFCFVSFRSVSFCFVSFRSV